MSPALIFFVFFKANKIQLLNNVFLIQKLMDKNYWGKIQDILEMQNHDLDLIKIIQQVQKPGYEGKFHPFIPSATDIFPY